MECLGLHNKPTAEVHPGHMLTGPKEEEEEEEEHPDRHNLEYIIQVVHIKCLFALNYYFHVHLKIIIKLL
jgi:hypothetical protein